MQEAQSLPPGDERPSGSAPAPDSDDDGDRKSKPGLVLPQGALRWGITGFVVASLMGFGVLFFLSKDLGASLSAFKRFDPRWGLVCLGLASMDWFGGGVRVWVLLKPLDIRVSYWKCVEISGATAALAYLTPSGAGGGPAHLYGLVREGVSVGRAAASNFASFLVNITFLSTAGLCAWFFGASSTIEDLRLPVAHISAARMFEWTASGFAVVVAIIVVFSFNPRPLRGWLIKTFGRGHRMRLLLRWIHELHASLLIYIRKGKLALLLATLSGTLHFGGRFLLGWAVLRGFGIHAGFIQVVTIHVMLQFLLTFMPTPGGTGVGEVLAPALMKPFLPASLLVAYTAIWRVFLTYLTVLVGGGLLMRWVGADHRRSTAS
jgi:hypothetical protein